MKSTYFRFFSHLFSFSGISNLYFLISFLLASPPFSPLIHWNLYCLTTFLSQPLLFLYLFIQISTFSFLEDTKGNSWEVSIYIDASGHVLFTQKLQKSSLILPPSSRSKQRAPVSASQTNSSSYPCDSQEPSQARSLNTFHDSKDCSIAQNTLGKQRGPKSYRCMDFKLMASPMGLGGTEWAGPGNCARSKQTGCSLMSAALKPSTQETSFPGRSLPSGVCLPRGHIQQSKGVLILRCKPNRESEYRKSRCNQGI